MRGADILVEMLIGYGVEVIFGVPGDTNVPLYEALQEREGKSVTLWRGTNVPPAIWPMHTGASRVSRVYSSARPEPGPCILCRRSQNPTCRRFPLSF